MVPDSSARRVLHLGRPPSRLALPDAFRTLLVVSGLALAAPAGTKAHALGTDELMQIIKAQESQLRSGTIVYTSHRNEFQVAAVPEEILRIDPDLPLRSELNREVITRNRLWFDLSRGRYKHEYVDQRDVSRILRDKGLPQSWLSLVLCTGSSLHAPGWPVVFFRYGGPQPRLTIMPLFAGFKVDEPPALHTGLIRSRVLATADSVTITEDQWQGQTVIKVTVTSACSCPMSAHYWVDPALGYRCHKVECRGPDGTLYQEMIADDFRLVDGIVHPFRYEERQWGSKGTLARQELTTVESARFNVQLAEEDLQLLIPAGTDVDDLVTRRHFPLRRAVIIDADNAADLGAPPPRPAPRPSESPRSRMIARSRPAPSPSTRL